MSKPRLKRLPSVTRTLPARLGFVTDRDKSGRGRVSAKWYGLARWKRLRQRVLDRDGHVCQQTGVALVGAHNEPNAPVVDHIQPHDGDPDLFWDEDNLQSVCKSWHDKEKQRQEHAERFGRS